jgi:hypothetical protein
MKVSNAHRVSGGGRAVTRAVVTAAALAAASGLAASGLVCGPAAAAATGSNGPRAAAARTGAVPAAAVSVAGVPQRTITLINGDRVVVTRFGRGMQEDAVTPAGNGVNRALLRMNVAGQAYEVPADALPFLGHGLSPSLFRVSSLLNAESAGRLPVQVSYQGQLPGLPGVTITRSGAGTAQGYLTAASAAAFGAALARQMGSDHARGSYGSDGMFAGGVSIGLPGQATATTARPDYPMHTLTVTGTDPAGAPDTGDTVQVFSADSLARFGDNVNDVFSAFYHGVAKYSVPTGHYVAIGYFEDMSGTTVTGFRTVILPQFTVTGNSAVGLAASAATDQVQMVTPRPAVAQDTTLTVDRGTAAGDSFTNVIDSGALPQWVNPTRPVTVGTLRAWANARLTAPAQAGQLYEYDLAFADPEGRIGSQRYLVTASNVAAVHAAYYQNAASTGVWIPGMVFGFQLTSFFVDIYSAGFPFTLPESETQYTSAGPSLIWLDSYVQSDRTLAGGQFSVPRTFVPGTSVTMGWNACPLHPTPIVNLLSTASPFLEAFLEEPTASRAGNTLTLDEIPFGDNTSGHTGTGFSTGLGGSVTASGSYELDQNGKQLASGKVAPGTSAVALDANLSSQPATDRLVLNATRTGPLFGLSTQTQTIWTWRSAPEPGATLPAGWICPVGNQACAVQPMMTLLYQVAGLGLDGSASPGNQLVVVNAGHLQLAPAAPVTAMTVAVSLNNGRTWRPAAVSALGGGRFAAAFAAPAPFLRPVYVSLRVQASDSAGNSITETVIRAYQTSS